jgi:transcriptional regulator with XRE-family HTH domain
MDTFPQWVNRKFVEWQASLGKRKTVEEFAIYLGVSRPLLNMWMNGNKKPGRENIKLLAETFGNDIYDVMGLPHPNPYLQVAINNWEFMSEEKQEQIARQIAEEAAKYEAKKITERIQTTSKRGKTRGD